MRKARNLTTGPIGKQIVGLALPILGSGFLQMLYNFVDMAWLGRLGSEYLAAAGAASVFFWLASSLSLLNKVGGEVTVAYEVGAHHEEGARDYAGHVSTLGLLMGLLVMVVYLLLAHPFVGFYRLSPTIHGYGVNYLRIGALGLPLTYLTVALTGVYNASGRSEVPFRATAIGVVTNLILDPVFIFALDLKIEGAAIATVLSQSVVLLLILRRLSLDRLFGGFPLLRNLSLATTRAILKIGTPVALMNSLMAIISMNLGRFASVAGGHIGVTTISVGGQLEGISWNTGQGLSTSLSAFVSQNHGARQPDRIKGGLSFTLKVAAVVGAFGFALNYFFGDWLFGLVIPEAPAIAAGATYLHINAPAQLFMMVEITFQGFFYGMKRSLPPALISIGGNALRIPLAMLLLPLFPGVETIWWIICGTCFLKGAAILIYYLTTHQKLLRQ